MVFNDFIYTQVYEVPGCMFAEGIGIWTEDSRSKTARTLQGH